MSIEINSSSVQTTQAPDLPVSQRDLWPDGAVAKKVFVMVDGYLPGYRWGGPIRSIANAAEQLSDRFEFWILTRDRDQMEHMPYPDVQVNAWNRVGKAMVYYASPDFLSFKMIRNLIAEVNPAIVYLNNFFPHDFTEQGICPSFHLKYLLLRRLGLVPQQPVIVAPRGCFSPGALEIKQNQKQAYITLSRRVGLYDGLVWQASAALEEQEIRAAWRKQINVQVAPNLPNVAMSIREQPGLPKHPGTARFVFFSRITPKRTCCLRFSHWRMSKVM